MLVKLLVEADLTNSQGKFEAAYSLAEKIRDDDLDGANPGTVTGDNDGEYDVSNWTVSIVEDDVMAPVIKALKEMRQHAKHAAAGHGIPKEALKSLADKVGDILKMVKELS